jgi:hypothetical protein
MMDYYEELGVDRSASASEIRHAYKGLVRLLHPDHCEEEGSRQMANLQMKRLNGVLAMLTDPVARAKYDWAISPRPAAVRRRGFGWAPPWFWPAIGALACLGLALVVSHKPRPEPTESEPRDPAPPIAAAVTTTPVRPKPAGLRRPGRASRRPSAAPEVELPPELPMAEPAPGRPVPEGAGPILRDVEFSAPLFPAAESGSAPARPALAGEWLFVPSPGSDPSGLYPPEYIELRVTERLGVLHGRYRARYRIADQAISPTVSFQFEGGMEAHGTRLPWRGAGGSHGDVTLRLLTNGALEVTWVANQMGTDLGLISGTATLVRKLE